jgi:hypothetical protein
MNKRNLLKPEERDDKIVSRLQSSDDSHSNNGVSLPNDPRHIQLKESLPEHMRPLFDQYIKSLLQHHKSGS